MEMAKVQAMADGQPLKNLFLDANVKSCQDMPKLWAYLRNRQIKEEEDKKKKEEEMMIVEMKKTQSAAANETQDIFDQILKEETQDDALEAIFSKFGAPGPSPQARPQQAALPPQGPPVVPKQGVPVQGQVVPSSAPQPKVLPPVPQVVPGPLVPPQCSAMQAPQQGQAAGHGQEQPPQQAQSPCGQAQGNGAQEGTGALTALAEHDVKNPSKDARNDYRVFIRQAQNPSGIAGSI